MRAFLSLCVLGSSLLAGCEVIAGFDRDKLDDMRTIGPTPLPSADGAIAKTPDASRPDAALIGPDRRDAGLDARVPVDAATVEDAASEPVDAAGLDAAAIDDDLDAG